jgi:uncharacterized linocin/CFP29 family protein
MRKNPFAQDVGVLTAEEILYVENKVLETFRYQLQARKIFPIVGIPDAKFTRYYDEEDPSEAVIDMDGKGQSDDYPEKTAHDLKMPVIHKEFLLNWRDIEISRRQGPSILDDSIRTATRKVAEVEDRLLISGECTTWNALGLEGLFTATGRFSQAASGAWPANAVHDVNDARAHLQGHGFVGIEPVMIGPPALVKCLDGAIANTGMTYRSFLLQNKLVSAIIETPNAYAADCGQDSVVFVIPGEGNFWAYQGLPLTVRLWEDKVGNCYGTVREAIQPVIGRAISIAEINSVTCS